VTNLHTIVALRNSVKTRSREAVTAAHRESQKADLYDGFERTYQPKDDEGDHLPPESKQVQLDSRTVLDQLTDALSGYWDLTASVDATNQVAKADVTVPTGNGVERITVLRDVPATHLLFLARELEDVYTFVRKLPVLNPGDRWEFDEAVNLHATEPIKTTRTKKVMKNHVKYDATERHPAQVEVFTEDVIVGTWSNTKYSGALTAARRSELLHRIDVLRLAIKEARERANLVEVVDLRVAKSMFDYILGG
jgi:hypothetical protein